MKQLTSGLALALVATALLVSAPPATATKPGNRIVFSGAQDYPSANVTYNGTASPGAITHLFRNGKADKYADLVLSNIVGGPVVLYGSAHGGFSGRRVLNNADTDASATRVADFNADGVPDIVSGGYTTQRVTVMLGRRDGSFRVTARPFLHGVWPSQFGVADLNRDGHLDIATTSYFGGRITILLGRGDGTFRSAAPVRGTNLALALLVADVNGDKVPDMAVTESIPTPGKLPLLGGSLGTAARGTVKILLGNGDGSFRAGGTHPVGVLSETIRYADLNEDGKRDLVVLNALVGNDASILFGRGGGRFAPERRLHLGGPTSIEPLGVRTIDGSEGLQIVDLNRDGHLDLAVTQMISSTLIIFEGDGRGHFTLTSQQYVTGFPEDLMAGDLDNDGCVDLAAPGNVPPVGPSDAGVARVSVLINRSHGCSKRAFGTAPPKTDVRASVVTIVFPQWLKNLLGTRR